MYVFVCPKPEMSQCQPECVGRALPGHVLLEHRLIGCGCSAVTLAPTLVKTMPSSERASIQTHIASSVRASRCSPDGLSVGAAVITCFGRVPPVK